MLTELEQRANDEARHAHRELVEKLEEYRMVASALEIQWVQELERANATEAKLAKAVDVDLIEQCIRDVLEEGGTVRDAAEYVASAILAELTGSKE